MLPRVYLETSVLSYLTSRPSRDLIVASNQQLTREWWEMCPGQFEVIASSLVLREAGQGDTDAAARRVALLKSVTVVEVSDAASDLARAFVAGHALPRKATEDALHLAVAATSAVDFLVTWNCRHLANAVLRRQIEAVCKAAGYDPPVICTPQELLGRNADELDPLR